MPITEPNVRSIDRFLLQRRSRGVPLCISTPTTHPRTVDKQRRSAPVRRTSTQRSPWASSPRTPSVAVIFVPVPRRYSSPPPSSVIFSRRAGSSTAARALRVSTAEFVNCRGCYTQQSLHTPQDRCRVSWQKRKAKSVRALPSPESRHNGPQREIDDEQIQGEGAVFDVV